VVSIYYANNNNDNDNNNNNNNNNTLLTLTMANDVRQLDMPYKQYTKFLILRTRISLHILFVAHKTYQSDSSSF
jgi:hypothetical protein